MNRRVTIRAIWVLVFCGFGLYSQAQPAPTEEQIWLYGSFQEINSASPVIGGATLSLALAKAVVAAIPPKYLVESADAGFDIPIIATIVDSMPVGDTFELTKHDFHLVIVKQSKTVDPAVTASSLVIQNEKMRLPIPLLLTGAVVKALQLAFKELDGMDEPLAQLVTEVKKTPPETLLKGEDRLMNSWLVIRLQ
ncbi:MAG: hypothetical protein C4527_19150 [Candidatus Omnitrophota bacterium]|jgi:hypothetical protein|nr:MAG: hypothetical protein C4527_19150 [Candidatus Omnitrophota bacterium]